MSCVLSPASTHLPLIPLHQLHTLICILVVDEWMYLKPSLLNGLPHDLLAPQPSYLGQDVHLLELSVSTVSVEIRLVDHMGLVQSMQLCDVPVWL
jgi:hypothetical protein